MVTTTLYLLWETCDAGKHNVSVMKKHSELDADRLPGCGIFVPLNSCGTVLRLCRAVTGSQQRCSAEAGSGEAAGGDGADGGLLSASKAARAHSTDTRTCLVDPALLATTATCAADPALLGE